eukprot:c10596_g1_i1.p1 GENE.c10596_g1_i1~~c10596_g1_i1.p1  ORF type:complete len:666 (+),score=110.21 c10596_g1_i1:152-2149(+)
MASALRVELPLDRFIVPVPQNFTCGICNKIPFDVKQSLCGHLFCNHCITSLLAVAPKHKKRKGGASVGCPTCFIQLNNSQIIDPPWVLVNLIKSLKVKCTFAAKGCDNQTLTLNTIDKHEEACGYGPAKCENANCPLSELGRLRRTEAVSHKEACEWRIVICPHGCKRQMHAKDLQQHTCAQKPVQCSAGCGQALKLNLIKQHQNNECSKTMVKCSVQGCEYRTERGARAGWDKHMHDECATHHNIPIKTVGQLSTTVKAQQATIQCLQQTVSRLENQISQLISNQSQQAHDIPSRLDEMQQQIDDHASTIEILQESNKNMAQTLRQQQSVVSQQNDSVTSIQSQLLTLQAYTQPQSVYASQLVQSSNIVPHVQLPPCSVDWVVKGIASKWKAGYSESSPELCFSHVQQQSLKYSFRVLIKVNKNADNQEHIGLYFSPGLGSNHTSLKWPIRNHIKCEILNVSGGKNKSSVFQCGTANQFFKEAAPGNLGSSSFGWPSFLDKHETVNSGNFVMNDAIIVRCTLLESTYDLGKVIDHNPHQTLSEPHCDNTRTIKVLEATAETHKKTIDALEKSFSQHQQQEYEQNRAEVKVTLEKFRRALESLGHDVNQLRQQQQQPLRQPECNMHSTSDQGRSQSNFHPFVEQFKMWMNKLTSSEMTKLSNSKQ